MHTDNVVDGSRRKIGTEYHLRCETCGKIKFTSNVGLLG